MEKCIATCLPGKEADVRVKLCRKTVEIGCHSDILRKSDVLSNWLGKRKEATNVSMDVGHLDTATFLRVLFVSYFIDFFVFGRVNKSWNLAYSTNFHLS